MRRTPKSGSQWDEEHEERRDGNHDPSDGGMPGGEAKLAEETQCILAQMLNNLRRGEGKGLSADQPFAETEKRHDQQPLRRRAEVIDRLDQRHVQPQHQRHEGEQQRRSPNDRTDADDGAQRDARRQLLRR
jgi:hypothetical protein